MSAKKSRVNESVGNRIRGAHGRARPWHTGGVRGFIECSICGILVAQSSWSSVASGVAFAPPAEYGAWRRPLPTGRSRHPRDLEAVAAADAGDRIPANGRGGGHSPDPISFHPGYDFWVKAGIDALGFEAWLAALVGTALAAVRAGVGYWLGRSHDAKQQGCRARLCKAKTRHFDGSPLGQAMWP